MDKTEARIQNEAMRPEKEQGRTWSRRRDEAAEEEEERQEEKSK